MQDGGAKQLLVVCTGNICRSPMAAGIIRKRLMQKELSNKIHVRSAGVMAEDGRPASQFAIELLGIQGIALGQHSAHRLRVEDIDAATLILVMEESQRRSIFYLSPSNLHKVVLLSELANEHEDIFDPYGASRRTYENVLSRIDHYIDAGWQMLLNLLSVHEK